MKPFIVKREADASFSWIFITLYLRIINLHVLHPPQLRRLSSVENTKLNYRVFPKCTKEVILCKVHIFLEGHKILPNLHLTFDCMYCSQKLGEEFAKILWPSQNIWTLQETLLSLEIHRLDILLFPYWLWLQLWMQL